jgi:cell division protein FtsB
VAQLEKKIIELEAANVEHESKNTQLEEHITQLDESVATQLKNPHVSSISFRFLKMSHEF